MQAFSSNSSHAYGIFVAVEKRGFPDNESLPIPIPISIPQVSILLNVLISYNTNSDNTLRTRAYDARLELDHPFHSFKSNSRDIISNMIDAMRIPLPLDRLRWKTQRFGVGNTEPLEGVEAMVSKTALVVSAMVENHAAAGLNKKLGILFTIEKVTEPVLGFLRPRANFLKCALYTNLKYIYIYIYIN
ncbi:PREDICTED: E3 ubiquitin-ligase [Prunus dulcis]|uniref:PREDICTED: E3 ubiquitin-ligase n=2 Tax=Prunus dulcis TaxID=3755 RepID=A0A5E4F5W1_PRUDU|nr:PREDICTED: E3 ubiquitin-ligase [Prunus dulcis]